MNLAMIVIVGVLLLALSMASTVGLRTIGAVGQRITASAQRTGLRPKIGGITIDWTAVAAVGVDTVVNGRTVRAGDKYIDYGTVLMRVQTNGQGFNVGYFAPFAAAATDGRGVVDATARGNAYILDTMIVMIGENPGLSGPTDHPAVYDGGYFYKSRVVGRAGNPTEVQLDTMFPNVTWVSD